MNQEHLRLCASAEWATTVKRDILPWVVDGRELGDDLLEVGPGPGLTTDVLRSMVARLTAVEVDASLASALAQRLAGSNVEVVHADATNLPFEDRRFSAATCLTMLHHVPSVREQDALLRELWRVLRAGGVVVGVDSLTSPDWLALHAGDICVPVDPHGFGERLARAGFTEVEVELSAPPPARRFRFAGRVSLRE
jgi:ubiquinone/menaquinone biosynthesis C-methylase UbiE